MSKELEKLQKQIDKLTADKERMAANLDKLRAERDQKFAALKEKSAADKDKAVAQAYKKGVTQTLDFVKGHIASAHAEKTSTDGIVRKAVNNACLAAKVNLISQESKSDG